MVTRQLSVLLTIRLGLNRIQQRPYRGVTPTVVDEQLFMNNNVFICGILAILIHYST